MLLEAAYRKRRAVLLLGLAIYIVVLMCTAYVVNIEQKQTCPPCQKLCPQDTIDVDGRAAPDAGEVLTRVASLHQSLNMTDTEFYHGLNESLSSLVHRSDELITEDVGTVDTGVDQQLDLPGTGKLDKIDWNDYKLMLVEAARKGLGEQGEAAVVHLSGQELKKSSELTNKYNFNAYVSDHISLERSMGDWRSEECQKQKFIKDIPQNSVSFISVFHNEKNSTLLRTVHAIINRSPLSLVREIILVDDLSTDAELKTPLDEYVARHFTNVRVLRNQERLGLIKSRMRGADFSSGRFLVFLDAHIEVNYNYLPPLLEPMILNYKTIACPTIDAIVQQTLKIAPIGGRFRGAFDWTMSFKRLPVEGEDETTPHASPVMVGCAFAITRRWWEELGKYDPGLEIWGAEQYEISFKSWMCGGSVVEAPCSRVAHLFRPLPYVNEVTNNNLIEKNYLRIANVWMDEFKDFILMRRPAMRAEQAGDISQQLELRKRLNCKSFKWFMKEIAPDILKYYPVIEPPQPGWGVIKNGLNKSLCINVVNDGRELQLGSCEPNSNNQFVFDWRHHFRQTKFYKCFAHTGGKSIFTWECFDVERKPTQNFAWDRQSGHIVAINTDLCIDVDAQTLKLYTTECDDDSNTQSWHLQYFNVTLVDEIWNEYEEKFH